MDWIITLIVVYGFIRLIMFLSNTLDGGGKPQVSKKSQVSATPKEPFPATPKKPPRRITIDDLEREYDEICAWGDDDELSNYLEKWHNRTFVVRGHVALAVLAFIHTNPRVETYALDLKGEHTKQYVSLSLQPSVDTLVAMEKSSCGPFRADFLFPVSTSIDTLISKGYHEVIIQGTFSGTMTACWLLASSRKGIRGVTAIFTDCEIVREL